MKKTILVLAVLLMAGAAQAEEPVLNQTPIPPAATVENTAPVAQTTLRQVESQYVCMVNNTVFDKSQIAVSVGDKTYYGCCEMCKARLAQDAQARQATDPVSGKTVDKASAIIGADANGSVYYFETQENLNTFNQKGE